MPTLENMFSGLFFSELFYCGELREYVKFTVRTVWGKDLDFKVSNEYLNKPLDSLKACRKDLIQKLNKNSVHDLVIIEKLKAL